MVAKLGDSSNYVSQIQKLLSFLGYDLIVDGHFGNVTVRSTKAFQKKSGLFIDGVVGPNTFSALKVAQKRTAKESHARLHPKIYPDNLNINTTHVLPPEQYNKQLTDKCQIYLHFTAGRPSAVNTIRGWGNNVSKVSTAFVVDGESGQVFEAFHPDYWGWHLGVKGTNGKLDKCSIGIEICSFGPLKKEDDKYYAWPPYDLKTKKYAYKTEVLEKNVYKLDEEFRGFKYFYAISDEQIENLEKLLIYLCKEYNIPVQDSFDNSWFDFKLSDLKNNKTPGIWTHVNVRKDKTDLYPDKRIIKMLNGLSDKIK